MMEPVAYLKNCRIIDNGGKEYDSLRFASADDKRGFAVVRLSDAEARIKELEAALSKINDIRNSIIGCQNINWSEHIYPLVAALDEAGVEGQGYPEAREYVGTLIERTNAAEARAEAAEALLKEALEVLDSYADPTGYIDGYGEAMEADAPVHPGLLAKATADKIRAARAIAEKIGVKDE